MLSAFAASLLCLSSMANAQVPNHPIVNFTNIASDSYEISITVFTDLTGLTLPTGLTSLEQLSYFSGGQSGEWWGEASMDPFTNLVNINFVGPTIHPRITAVFGYGVNLDKIAGPLTSYNLVTKDAILVGPNYDFLSNKLQITTFNLSSPNASPLPVPEPETYAMMLAGLGLLGVAARRRKQKAAA
jgi:hypothetical protein